MSLDIDGWLRGIGLEQYAQAFHDNGIDLGVLPDLTDNDLVKRGLLLGHRRKLLRAVTELEAVRASEVAAAASRGRLDTAERRQLTIMFCDLVELDGAVDTARPRGHARGRRRLSPLLRRSHRARRRLCRALHG